MAHLRRHTENGHKRIDDVIFSSTPRVSLRSPDQPVVKLGTKSYFILDPSSPSAPVRPRFHANTVVNTTGPRHNWLSATYGAQLRRLTIGLAVRSWATATATRARTSHKIVWTLSGAKCAAHCKLNCSGSTHCVGGQALMGGSIAPL